MLAIKCCVNSPPGPVAGGIPGRVKKTKKKKTANNSEVFLVLPTFVYFPHAEIHF